MPHPLIIVFDLDGTLVDTAPDLAATTNAVLAGIGCPPLSEASIRRMIGHGARALVARGIKAAGGSLDDALLDRLFEEFLALYETRIADASKPFPGIEAALDHIAARGAIAAVCTNKPERLSGVLLHALGLSGRFAAIVGGDSLAVRKPDPLHLLTTIERAGGVADNAVMVGDSATDLNAARAAEVPMIGVSFGYSETPMAELVPDMLIDDYAEFADALARLID